MFRNLFTYFLEEEYKMIKKITFLCIYTQEPYAKPILILQNILSIYISLAFLPCGFDHREENNVL